MFVEVPVVLTGAVVMDLGRLRHNFSIDYILPNGTMGCAFKGDETSNPACVVVVAAEIQSKKRRATNYSEKHQVVHAKGVSIEFIGNCALEAKAPIHPNTLSLAYLKNRPL